MIRNVLISGAGVAGLALAYWLDKAGVDVTVIERVEGFRRGGQAVDVRGVALDVVKAMGIFDQVRALRTQLGGMSMVDRNGVEVYRTTERTFSAGRLDSDDIEIFRDDLCELLLGALGPRVKIHCGDHIIALDDDGERAHVSFARGGEAGFDAVFGADGIYSKTRRMVFDNEADVVHSLNAVLALFTTSNSLDLVAWQVGHREDALGVIIYPNLDHSELRVGVGFGSAGLGIGHADVARQKDEVAARGASLGGPFKALFAEMRTTPEFYYNELAQIRMPAWSKGTVALVGDAAYCASPFSGQGTSLALVGAFVLAMELSRHPSDLAAAFAAYEQRMRPYVRVNQDMVDMSRKGPTPDDVLSRAKNGIDLADLMPLIPG